MDKRVISGWLGLILIFPWPYFQFVWQMLLVEDPELFTYGDLAIYLVFSLVIILGSIIIITRSKGFKGMILILVLAPSLFLWGLALVDSFDYQRPLWTDLTRYIGFCTTIGIMMFDILFLFRNRKDSN